MVARWKRQADDGHGYRRFRPTWIDPDGPTRLTDEISARGLRGRRSQAGGFDAESRACAALVRDGWTVLGRRIRTAAGEVDVVAEKNGVAAFVEVKSRPTLAEAAFALSPRQRERLLGAAEILLAEHPDWGREGVRFDILLVDATGAVRRIADAFRRD